MFEVSKIANQILVVIPTLNEEKHIEACFRSLMCGSEELKNVKFVVADGGSTDRTAKIVTDLGKSFPNLELIHNPKKIQAAAVNIAARTVDKERSILVRCDAHSIYPKDFVLKVAYRLKEAGAASVVVPMDAVGSGSFQSANAWVVDQPLGSGGSAHRGGLKSGYVDHGHHAAFDRKVFLELGGYDESFTHNEDAEYDCRVIKSGRRIYMDAGARIQYFARDSFMGVWKQYYKYGVGRARNMKKHRSAPKLRQAIPLLNLIAMAAGLLVWMTMGRNGEAFSNTITSLIAIEPFLYMGALLGVSVACMLKLKSAKGAYAGLALAAMHNGWALGFLKGMLFVPRPGADEDTLVLTRDDMLPPSKDDQEAALTT